MSPPIPPTIHIGSLPFIELVSALNALVENQRAPFRGKPDLSPEGEAFIQDLAHFRLRGLEFFEFALLLETPARPKTLAQMIQAIHRLPDPVFVQTLFGGDLSEEVVDVLLSHFGKLDFLLSRDLKQASITHRELDIVFRNLKAFRRGFELAAKALTPFIAIERERYAPAIGQVKALLADRTPLEVSQTLMGKTFKRVSAYTDYWFVPAFHYHRKTMRIFSSRILLTVFSLETRTMELSHPDLVKFLKALGDDTRLAIARRLAERPHTGKELALELALTTATITHHLDQLRACGLLHEERDGTSKYVSLNRTVYQDFLRAMALST